MAWFSVLMIWLSWACSVLVSSPLAWFTTDWICCTAWLAEAGTVVSVDGKVSEPDATAVEVELPEPDVAPDEADAEVPAPAPDVAPADLEAEAVDVPMLPEDAVFDLFDEPDVIAMTSAMTTTSPIPAPIRTPGFGFLRGAWCPPEFELAETPPAPTAAAAPAPEPEPVVGRGPRGTFGMVSVTAPAPATAPAPRAE